MKSTIEQLGNEFSIGNFKQIYPHMADHIEWNLIGAELLKGKQAVVDHCDKMFIMMQGSTSVNKNLIVSENQVAVQGYCDYTDDQGQACRVEYCDIFKFANEMITGIDSYIIDLKNVN